MQTKQKISASRLTAIHLHLNCWVPPVTQIRWSLLAETDKDGKYIEPLQLEKMFL